MITNNVIVYKYDSPGFGLSLPPVGEVFLKIYFILFQALNSFKILRNDLGKYQQLQVCMLLFYFGRRNVFYVGGIQMAQL